ncbi:hypothetical protein M011DRAFT_479253 [Sporormia fimetaria CBS 119925]|uniref:Uncharacterized protein n=1 Tax=Sporormia fimetaria CBS 119925 TaxID=1340428 RepID=A0A6A6V7E6_9PLEO|nr:hypothetical protein M011DRAFT_479253 [Sporormia fimetaria CBS 119925]
MSQETTTTSPITREQAILPPPPTSKTSSFCKGAISLQQNPRSLKHALRLQTRPDGLYNHTRLFQCRHCHFSGPSYTSSSSGKKEIISDPTIHISSTGIPYRWTYLAKSHVKTKMVGEMGVTGMTSFACLVCMGVGRMSGVYGGVETLMEHLRDEHGVDGGFVLD